MDFISILTGKYSKRECGTKNYTHPARSFLLTAPLEPWDVQKDRTDLNTRSATIGIEGSYIESCYFILNA